MERTNMNIEQVAEYLGVNTTQVRRLINHAKNTPLPAARLNGKTLLFSKPAVDAWIAEQMA